MTLQDKIAIVTGGATGIGKAISQRLAREGAHVIIVNRRAELGEAVAAELRDAGYKAEARSCDVSDTTAMDTLVKGIVKDLGAVHILVNNAGVTRDNLLMRLKEADWDTVIDINLKGAFNGIKAVSRPMMKQEYGRIVSIASVVGIMGNAGQANYSAAKAGIIGLTKSTARELASRNVTANVVAPGFVPTDMTAVLPEEAINAMLQNVPLRRVGQPEEIAAAVAFFCSEEAGYITGQTLSVDGGMVMN